MLQTIFKSVTYDRKCNNLATIKETLHSGLKHAVAKIEFVTTVVTYSLNCGYPLIILIIGNRYKAFTHSDILTDG